MDFQKEMEKKISDINGHLERYLSESGLIYESMSYSIFAGGKRLRPLLFLGAMESVCGGYEKGIEFACALEMIHTYSLIHDDLPAMDNDDFRRGNPTNHKKFGDAIAILAGDGLLNLAFETMINASIKDKSLNALLAMREISNASGVKGMVGGQVLDILAEGKIIDETQLLTIHRNKTGALFRAALVAGAIMGDADQETINLFDEIGNKIGLVFQIKDDILDVCGSEEQMGKPLCSDEKNCKTTYVTIYGLENAKKHYDTMSNEILMNLERVKDPFLYELVKKLIDRVH